MSLWSKVFAAALADLPGSAALEKRIDAIQEVRWAGDEIGALRIKSDVIDGDVWLARDRGLVAEVARGVAEAGHSIPVLTFEDAEYLSHESDEQRRLVLLVIGMNPGFWAAR